MVRPRHRATQCSLLCAALLILALLVTHLGLFECGPRVACEDHHDGLQGYWQGAALFVTAFSVPFGIFRCEPFTWSGEEVEVWLCD